MEVIPRHESLVVRFLLTPGSKLTTCNLQQLTYTGEKVKYKWPKKILNEQVRNGRCEFRLSVWIPRFRSRKYPPNWVKINYQLKYPLRVGRVTGEQSTRRKTKNLNFYKCKCIAMILGLCVCVSPCVRSCKYACVRVRERVCACACVCMYVCVCVPV